MHINDLGRKRIFIEEFERKISNLTNAENTKFERKNGRDKVDKYYGEVFIVR